MAVLSQRKEALSEHCHTMLSIDIDFFPNFIMNIFKHRKVERILQLAPKYPLPWFHKEYFTSLSLSQIYLPLYRSISPSFLFSAFQNKLGSSPLTFLPKSSSPFLTCSLPNLFFPHLMIGPEIQGLFSFIGMENQNGMRGIEKILKIKRTGYDLVISVPAMGH